MAFDLSEPAEVEEAATVSPEPKSYLHVSLNRFIWLEVIKLIIYMSAGRTNSRSISEISVLVIWTTVTV